MRILFLLSVLSSALAAPFFGSAAPVYSGYGSGPDYSGYGSDYGSGIGNYGSEDGPAPVYSGYGSGLDYSGYGSDYGSALP